MFKKTIFILTTLISFIFASKVFAEEAINVFDATIKINQDSTISVTENIKYDFGLITDKPKHGIFRDIPYKYTTTKGNYSVKINSVSVTDEDGKNYNFEISDGGGLKRIKIGDADITVYGEKNYNIKYDVARAINFFQGYDELYWNVTGNGWTSIIKKTEAFIELPVAVDSQKIKAECFAGKTGDKTKCGSVELLKDKDGKVDKIKFTNGALSPSSGLTVVVGLPKGIINQPSKFVSILNFFKDNWPISIPLIVFFALLSYWYKFGRDPEGKKTIIAQFEVPDNLTPAEVGTIIDERVNRKDISSEIINLAVKGYIKIHHLPKEHLIGKTDEYYLQKLKPEDDLRNKHEKLLLSLLFKGENKIDTEELKSLSAKYPGVFLENENEKIIRLSDIKDHFSKDYQTIEEKIYSSLVSKGYFPSSPKKVRQLYFGIGIFIIFLGFILIGKLSGFILGGSIIISGILELIFSFFLPRKTIKGVLAKEYILGLKRYLDVAEKDRINFHNAPEKKPENFEKLLPVAMVLGVEKAWAKQFEGIYSSPPAWYNDYGSTSFSSGNFSTASLNGMLAGFVSHANSAMFTNSNAAGGGSGFGGGGFSGGGFGGGGGGSW